MAKMLIWGGGPYHPTRAQSDWFKQAFEPAFSVEYREDRAALGTESLAGTDLLVLAGMDDPKFTVEAELQYWETPAARRTTYQPLEEEYFQSLLAYLALGKPLLVHHGAILSFPEREKLNEVFDGRWVLGKTSHPPYQKFKVSCLDPSNPIMAGMADFEIEDEMYLHLQPPRRSRVLLQCRWEGQDFPLAWAGRYGDSRVVYSGLGHDVHSLANESLRLFLKNSVRWLTADPGRNREAK